MSARRKSPMHEALPPSPLTKEVFFSEVNWEKTFIKRRFFCTSDQSKKKQLFQTHYRVNHHVSDLGCVDFDCGCSTICPILPGLMT